MNDHVTDGDGDAVSKRKFAPASQQQCHASIPNPAELVEWTGVVRSANFGLVAYPNNENCEWTIKLSEGSRVSIHFTVFTLEGGGAGGCYDFVEVFDGGSANAPLIGQFCGSTVPDDIVSSGPEMHVRFVSDNTNGFHGFSLDYTGTCAGVSIPIQDGEKVTLESPLYPVAPPPDAACDWQIVAPDDFYIQLNFMDFQDSDDSCANTNIKIYYRESLTVAEEIICPNSTAPPILTSPTNTLTIGFTADVDSSFAFAIECTANALPCSSSPCLHGATCSDIFESVSPTFQCACPAGYAGARCEAVRDECESNPCGEYALECIDKFDEFICVCETGYTGLQCDIDIDECTGEGSVCFNGGTCTNTFGHYECSCPESFSGELCEEDVDECLGNPCQNGGTCANVIGSYECRCSSAFTGTHCEMDVDECADDPCANGGTCSNTYGSFECRCSPAFTGQHCDIDIDECLNNPCMNEGVCSNSVGSYECECSPSFSGVRCEVDVDECETDPCLNGGTCINTVGSYNCQCTPAFTGIYCEQNVNECDLNPCAQGGTCLDVFGSYECQCLSSFTGQHCEVDVNECENHPCLNGGTCYNVEGSYRCECPSSFTGVRCEDDVDECVDDPCRNQGSCVNTEGGYSCDCSPSFSGQLCEADVDECVQNPCSHGGTCFNTLGSYECRCSSAFTGQRCEQDVDECETTPCQNGGFCLNTAGSYECNCSPSYTGLHCEEDVDECASNPCSNGGTCSNSVGEFQCTCTASYTGDLCEEDVDECVHESSLCHNGGSCNNLPGSYECECPQSFSGSHCENDIDECSLDENLCQHGGTCHNTEGHFYCTCADGFEGSRCEIKVTYSLPECPAEIDVDSNLFWNTTRAGEVAQTACPPGTIGNAYRQCEALTESTPPSSVWQTADLSECRNPTFQHVTDKVDELEQRGEVTAEDVIDLVSLLSNLTSTSDDSDGDSGHRLYPGDIEITTEALSTVADLSTSLNDTLSETDIDSLAYAFTETIDNVLDESSLSAWKTMNDPTRVSQQLTSVVTSSETMALSLALAKNGRFNKSSNASIGDENLQISKKNLEFDVVFVETTDNTDASLSFTRSGGSLSLPQEVLSLAARETSGKQVTLSMPHRSDHVAIYRARFTSLASLYSALDEEGISRLNTDVLATKILGIDEALFQHLSRPVVGVYRHNELSNVDNPRCVFLDTDREALDNDPWKTTGCLVYQSNDTHTVCHCYHLTNFAVIMDIHGVQSDLTQGHKTALSILSQIGGSLSVLGSMSSVIIYEFFRLKSDRIRVHENLGVAIASSQLIFLVGIERTEIQWVCKAVAIAFHYTITAMFCWMLIEGVHLYVMLIKVFGAANHIKKYFLAGWGIPLLVVGISAGVFYKDYAASSTVCWMSTKAMLGSFIPTVSIVVVVNTSFLIMVLRVMMKSMSAKYKSRVSSNTSQVKAGLKAAAILLPLLGLTWVFGFISINSHTLVFTYLFAILNSFQGLFFFLAHCVLNIEVRKAYERRFGKTKHGMVSSTALSSVSTSGIGVAKRNGSGQLKSAKSIDSDTEKVLCRKSSSNSQGYQDNPLMKNSVDDTSSLNNDLNMNVSRDPSKRKTNPDAPVQINDIQYQIKRESDKNVNQENSNDELVKDAKAAMENILSKSNNLSQWK
ncbi:uncharacterized protein [Diadema antillarum]|uniref:uncharacterized protein n=1 Tax=Diadema antillarum TaxID=105358 RepID=UPI003A8573F4